MAENGQCADAGWGCELRVAGGRHWAFGGSVDGRRGLGLAEQKCERETGCLMRGKPSLGARETFSLRVELCCVLGQEC
jgi:hypothetical protein